MEQNERGRLMFSEIHEQPQAIREFIAQEQTRVWKLAEHWRQRRPRFIFIAARGTSDHAALYAKYLFETMNGIPMGLASPSIASIYQAKVDVEGALFIGISQSGEAADVISVMEQARKAGADTLAITNVADSELAQSAEHLIPLHAGPEKAVAATKTFTSTMAALLLLSAALGDNQQLLSHLTYIPVLLNDVLTNAEEIISKVERFRFLEDCVVLGRSYNLATAYELALKLRETTYVRAQAYASPDFLHGPIATLYKGSPVFAFVNQGATLPSVIEVLEQVKSRGAEIIMIGNAPDALAMADVTFPVNTSLDVPEVISPFPGIVAGQIISQTLSLLKGIDPDAPRGLHKVTITM